MEGGETVLDVLHERRIYVQLKKRILPMKIGSSSSVVVEMENLNTNKRSQKARLIYSSTRVVKRIVM